MLASNVPLLSGSLSSKLSLQNGTLSAIVLTRHIGLHNAY